MKNVLVVTIAALMLTACNESGGGDATARLMPTNPGDGGYTPNIMDPNDSFNGATIDTERWTFTDSTYVNQNAGELTSLTNAVTEFSFGPNYTLKDNFTTTMTLEVNTVDIGFQYRHRLQFTSTSYVDVILKRTAGGLYAEVDAAYPGYSGAQNNLFQVATAGNIPYGNTTITFFRQPMNGGISVDVDGVTIDTYNHASFYSNDPIVYNTVKSSVTNWQMIIFRDWNIGSSNYQPITVYSTH